MSNVALACAALESAAVTEIRTCLLRWERLAAIPARLTTPLLQCSIDSAMTLSRRAYARGDSRRGDELFDAAVAEGARREAQMAWSGRSAVAWQALAERFTSALWAARAAGTLSPEAYRHAHARLVDCRHRVALATQRAAAGYPATA